MATSLFDIVPWTVGFAHSWALRWFLEQPELSERVLDAIPSLPGPAPHVITGGVELEKPLKPRRTDLSFDVRAADGSPTSIALETKVNDPYSESQVLTYAQYGHVVIYAPGTTGLLIEPVRRPSASSLVRGLDIVSAVSARVGADPLIDGYVTTVARHAEWMNAARTAALAGEGWSPPTRDAGVSRLEEKAAVGYRGAVWLGEICRRIRATTSDDIRYRATAFDVGYYWHSSLKPVRGRDAFVELTLDHGGNANVWIKVGGGREGLREGFDALRSAGAPDSAWDDCNWGRGGTRSVWKAAGNALSVEQGFALGEAAAAYLAEQAD
jgi:hypothetical protein